MSYTSRRAKQLEQLIMDDFNRMLEVQSRAEQKLYFSRMCEHVKERSPAQVRTMERARGIFRFLKRG